jgi:dipeptidyl-peptidase-4
MHPVARLICLTSVLLSGFALTAQEAASLTLAGLYLPGQRVSYVDPLPAAWLWRPDGSLVEERLDRSLQQGLARLGPPAWEPKPLLNRAQFVAAMAGAGLDPGAAEAAWRGPRVWNPARSAFLVTAGQDLYLMDLARGVARRITSSPEPKEAPAFSPDGARVAYLMGSDLYVTDLETTREIRLTEGGDGEHLHGRLDWLYQEELYQRGQPGGFWWSPDSTRIALLCLDESQVPSFTLLDDRSQPQRRITYPYPRAGEPNPEASLGVTDLEGHLAWMEDPHPGEDTLLVRVGWDPMGSLVATYQDRTQRWLECLRFTDGKGQPLVREEARDGWIEQLPLPVFLQGGGFLWQSARTGFHHIYRYDAQNRLVAPVTAGPWDVRLIHGVDETTGRVYFSATQRNPIGLDAYSADLEGGANHGLRRLTDRPGTHAVVFNGSFTAMVDRWSDIETPPQQQLLLTAEGRLLRQMESPTSPAFKLIRRGRVSFQQVMTRDGVPLETMLVLPPGFTPARKYPVYHFVYGGPGVPLVRNAYQADGLWFQFLAQQGIVTWICDNRSASGKGAASAQGVYRNLGAQELQDQLDGLAWLKAQGWADMGRIALSGYSYGGFLAAYALTHSEAWKLGIIGAPVVDWRLYDSIYTERLMGLPEDNPGGYASASPLKAAARLKAKVLLIQGTLDENVHLQQTVQFLDAIQHAGRSAPLILLPGAGHVPDAPQHVWAMRESIWEFLRDNL